MREAKDPGRGRLAGKVTLVTGAGPGLGGAIAAALAAEGAKLVVCDIAPEALDTTRSRLAAMGAEALALPCDVSDSAAVDAMFARAAERFGTVHILVNHAARVPDAPADEARRNRHYQYLTTPMPRQEKRFSKYRGSLQTGLSLDEIDAQLQQLRGEWERPIS